MEYSSSINGKCNTTSAVVMVLALIFDFSVVFQTANLEGFVRESEWKKQDEGERGSDFILQAQEKALNPLKFPEVLLSLKISKALQ